MQFLQIDSEAKARQFPGRIIKLLPLPHNFLRCRTGNLPDYQQYLPAQDYYECTPVSDPSFHWYPAQLDDYAAAKFHNSTISQAFYNYFIISWSCKYVYPLPQLQN